MRRDSRLSVALHALLHVAEHPSPVTSATLGEKMRANPVVIRRTMAGLRDAGLVESTKGHGGGWRVTQSLGEISLLDVYRALGEPVLIQQHRAIRKPECLVEQAVARTLEHTFRDAEDHILRRFGRMKLAELSSAFHAQAKKSRDRKRGRS